MSQVSYGTITISDLTDIDSVVNYYLATDLSSGVTKNNPASGHGTWTTNIQNATLNSTFQYLWSYEKILGAGNIEISSTDPIIIGHFGTNGTNGADGNSITSIDEYYKTTNSSTVTSTNPGSSGWSKNTLVVPTSTNKYLWNYQIIHYSKTADEGSYNDARIIGVYGDTGERGTSILKVTTAPTATSGTIGGFSYSYRMSLSTVKTQSSKNEVLVGDIIEYGSNHYQVGYVSSSYVYLGPVTSIKGADGIQYYTHIYYSSKQTPTSASDVSSSPSGKTFVGIQTTTSSTAPAWNDSNWNWTKYIGTDATQYYAFVKYATDANGTNMQDTPASGYDYVGTYTGTKANPTASDFNWSKYTGEPGTPATQYYAFIKYATSSAGANMTDTPTSNTTYVGTYSGTKSNPTASDYKWSEYVGADGISVINVRELYWLKTNSTNPSQITWNSSTSQPSQTIYSTDRTNSWTSTVPTYVTDGTYYTCVETSLSNNTKVWSVPVQNIALTNANSNAASALSQAANAQERVGAAEANIIALQSKLAYMWNNLSDKYHDYSYDGQVWNKPDYPAGTYMASGIENTNFDTENSDTYGYNTLLRHNKLALRYNNIDMTTLTTGALTFFIPLKEEDKWIQGAKGLEINADGINLFNPEKITIYKEYLDRPEGTNPKALGLYENDGERFIPSQDTSFENKTYYYTDLLRSIEVSHDAINFYVLRENDEKIGMNLSSEGAIIYDAEQSEAIKINYEGMNLYGSNVKIYEPYVRNEYYEGAIPQSNPHDEDFYELIDNEYELTEDTTYDSEKTYYKKILIDINPQEKKLYELIDNEYELTEDTTYDSEKVYYIKVPPVFIRGDKFYLGAIDAQQVEESTDEDWQNNLNPAIYWHYTNNSLNERSELYGLFTELCIKEPTIEGSSVAYNIYSVLDKIHEYDNNFIEVNQEIINMGNDLNNRIDTINISLTDKINSDIEDLRNELKEKFLWKLQNNGHYTLMIIN